MTYKRRDRKFEAHLCEIDEDAWIREKAAEEDGAFISAGCTDRKRRDERILKSSWHALIALVGCYELRNHRTTASKVLACGLISFHLDAAICDWLDRPTVLQRLLRRMR